MVENKKVMASNILHYMEDKNVKATDICQALGIKHNTFSDWVNAKSYPRIDKIERMANYFGIPKAFLVEENPTSDLILSDDERNLIVQFRSSDGLTKESIKRMLEYAKISTERMKKDGTIQ